MDENIREAEVKKELGLDANTKMVGFELKDHEYYEFRNRKNNKLIKGWVYIEEPFDVYLNNYLDLCKIKNVKSVDEKYDLNHEYPIYVAYNLIHDSEIVGVDFYTEEIDDYSIDYITFFIKINDIDDSDKVYSIDLEDKSHDIIENQLNQKINKIYNDYHNEYEYQGGN
ncbi:hypothetical protein [Rhodospirillum sp. A1_3_36]|uniref:hypothetical protein n=1 Tax=Rhodospirillum sp. A1_3_36 TaxID=3391666 RepID=UPI0039A70995